MTDTTLVVAFPDAGDPNVWSIVKASLPAADVPALLQDLLPWQVSYYPAGDDPGVLSFGHYAPGWLERLRARSDSVEIVDHDDFDTSLRIGTAPGVLADIEITFEPGLAFGDFRHPSTRLCAAAIERERLRSRVTSLADIGCGSGILALVAARRGIKRVAAYDIDPYARFIARKNAAQNDLRIDVSDDFPEGRFDIVAANIWVSAFPMLSAALSAALEPTGTLLLSGFRSELGTEVEAYFPELQVVARVEEAGFLLLSFSR